MTVEFCVFQFKFIQVRSYVKREKSSGIGSGDNVAPNGRKSLPNPTISQIFK